jgi:hypothetical protein
MTIFNNKIISLVQGYVYNWRMTKYTMGVKLSSMPSRTSCKSGKIVNKNTVLHVLVLIPLLEERSLFSAVIETTVAPTSNAALMISL